MTQSNFTGKVHSFFVDDPIYFKKIRLMFCRIEYFYMFINNPELIDITDDIIENYTGELKEMRIELAKLIDNSKKNNSSKFDDSYYKEFNPIANKLSTDFSKISSKDSNDLTYIKEVLILLQASHDIADIDSICTNNDLVSKISKNSLTNTSGYISRLTTLKNSIK